MLPFCTKYWKVKKYIHIITVLHFRAKNFFWRNFFATFSTDPKSASNSAIIDTYIEIIWIKFLGPFHPNVNRVHKFVLFN